MVIKVTQNHPSIYLSSVFSNVGIYCLWSLGAIGERSAPCTIEMVSVEERFNTTPPPKHSGTLHQIYNILNILKYSLTAHTAILEKLPIFHEHCIR